VFVHILLFLTRRRCHVQRWLSPGIAPYVVVTSVSGSEYRIAGLLDREFSPLIAPGMPIGEMKIALKFSGNSGLGGCMKHSISVRNCVLSILALAVVLMVPLTSMADPTVQLASSVSSPQPVGTLVTWTATASDPDQGILMYAFSNGFSGKLALVRDFGYKNSFPSNPALQEGTYQVQVTVRNNSTGKTATATQTFVATAIANNSNPAVVSPTANPLVALFSAIGCPASDTMLVSFQTTGHPRQTTAQKPCDGRSMNFYVAGMYASTQYSMTGAFFHNGNPDGLTTTQTFTTGPIPGSVLIPTITIKTPAPPAGLSEPILVHAYLFSPFVQTGTDLAGNVLWYYSPYDAQGGYMTRPVAGGSFWFLGGPNTDQYLQPVRQIDLAGNTVVETNLGRINEQLTAIGQTTLTAVDHEVRTLPNGNILMIASTDRILGPNIQNGADIVFNELVVLNPGLQLVWSWNATTCGNCATQLPPTRMAILGETCQAGSGGCPPLSPPNTIANDWLHGNSAELAPDGSILMSLRHQDWVIKIDYANGTGTGNILWRLGLDGDFTIVGDLNDTYPWFSHQHDVEHEFGTDYVSLFDNGNTRISQNPTENSRGQLLKLNESTKTATLIYNLDLAVKSMALGTAQVLLDAKKKVIGLHFEAGFANGNSSQSISFYKSGTLNMNSDSSPAYRSFQMRDLYTLSTQP
jgi:arylsulfate sulfotransferase